MDGLSTFPAPANNPVSNQVLRDLRSGPQRLSVLQQRYGLPVRYTIDNLRKTLPESYRIVGSYQRIATKFGFVKDFVYRLKQRGRR